VVWESWDKSRFLYMFTYEIAYSFVSSSNHNDMSTSGQVDVNFCMQLWHEFTRLGTSHHMNLYV
jgi:hypothetical protein